MIVPPKSPIPCHYLASQYAKRVIALIDVDICCTSINRNMLRRVTGRSLNEDKELVTATVLNYLDFEDDTPVLTARAEKAARIAAYEQVLGSDATTFGSDRAGRLASLLRDGDYRDEARHHVADARAANSHNAH